MKIVYLYITMCLCTISSAAQVKNLPLYKQEPDAGERPLLHAVYHENLEEVNRLLTENPGLLDEKCTNKLATPLAMAVIKNNLEMVRLILDRMGNGSELVENGVQSIDSSPLRMAVRNENVEIAQLLMDYGANASAVTLGHRSMLHEAVSAHTNMEMVRVLLSKGAKSHALDCRGQLPILFAIRRGDLNMVKLLKTASDYSPRMRDREGNSVFHMAAAEVNIECLKVLSENTAQSQNYLDQRNRVSNTALHLAATKPNSLPTIQWLLSHGASAQLLNCYGQSALHFSAMNGLVGAVRVLAPNGVRINDKDRFQRTPLHYAVEKLFPPVVSELITNRVRVNLAAENGKVELHLATSRDPSPLWLRRAVEMKCIRLRTQLDEPRLRVRRDVIRQLLSAYANPQVQDNDGRTSLHMAALNGLEVIDELLIPKTKINTAHNAGKTLDINLRDKNRKTALDYAVELNHLEICQKLLEHNAIPNTDPQLGPTPLHTAVLNQNVEIVQSLVDRIKGEDIDHPDSEGNTAMKLAVSGENRIIVDILLGAGPQPDTKDKQSSAPSVSGSSSAAASSRQTVHEVESRNSKGGPSVDEEPAYKRPKRNYHEVQMQREDALSILPVGGRLNTVDNSEIRHVLRNKQFEEPETGYEEKPTRVHEVQDINNVGRR